MESKELKTLISNEPEYVGAIDDTVGEVAGEICEIGNLQAHWAGPITLPQVPPALFMNTAYGWDAALIGWPVIESQALYDDEQPDTHCQVLVAGFQKYPSQVCWPPDWAYNHAFISISSTHNILPENAAQNMLHADHGNIGAFNAEKNT